VVLAARLPRRWITDGDGVLLRGIARLRSEPLTTAFRAVEQLGSANAVRAIGWSTILALLLTRRIRHLLSYLAILLAVVVTAGTLNLAQGRMRPTDIEILGSWRGYAHPAVPVATFAALMVGAVYTLAPEGSWRSRGRLVGAGLVLLLGFARLYLGADHPSDVLAALALGWAGSVLAYRLVVPEEAFPIRYRRERTAHLELTPRRTAAICEALAEQLGIQAESVEAFGWHASAGSSPLRIRRADGGALFGKLYALNHLRSDRSYKLVRLVLYGRLEDEKPFASVRRLVEYEDHLLRLLRDGGLPVPPPHGFVEITPEREYVLAMAFVEGARELGTDPVTDREIDEALGIVRKLWQAGVAHRDIKPSNLLARDGQIYLIDVAFATVRPTPWRQAVDLANMMLTLALVSQPERIYDRAVRQFSPEDIAEAFAACRSVTIPSQLRARLRKDSRDLIGDFRRLAPPRDPVRIQLWSLHRVLILLALLAAIATGVALVYAYARVAGLL
jgi:tRNA A-37 threonylcarbamoyl transferase component Bud32/membrane-associated phospholipid phosphatase